MARAVYSELLIDSRGINLLAGYAVGDGLTVVVRDIAVFQNGTPEDTAFGLYSDNTGTYGAYHLFTDPYESWHWEGRQVFTAGDTVYGQTTGENYCHMRICGYVLTAT
jgi:hypothetical protein